jgi:hypothetical protein
MKKTSIFILTLAVLLLVSVFYNIKPTKDKFWFVQFSDANTRCTYDSFHHIKEAQKHATGKGIKVGILDKYFGYSENEKLYAGGRDFTGNTSDFETVGEHGLWMATTLKEIARDIAIYALNARCGDRTKEKTAIVEAIDWAINNQIDVLTYSAEPFQQEDRAEIDKAVLKAIQNNVVIIFLHYDLAENILPYGFFPKGSEGYSRESDVNIYHYDYNLLLLSNYENYVKAGRISWERSDMPYFSFSSMPPVLAGIVAMMKETNPTLTVADIKKILIETSREVTYNDYKVEHVVDAVSAIDSVMMLKNE